ncbi:hypothetical protein C0995_008380 [Termitomyces sp. Mi166|nr:hypothetical protein C0995_008380 [Termitomyces sp. Mi166\
MFAPFRLVWSPVSIVHMTVRGLKAVVARRYTGSIADIAKAETVQIAANVQAALEREEGIYPQITSYGFQ